MHDELACVHEAHHQNTEWAEYRHHQGCKVFTLHTQDVSSLKLQALVYNILPPTIAITDYPIGLKKLPASGQFFLFLLVIIIYLPTIINLQFIWSQNSFPWHAKVKVKKFTYCCQSLKRCYLVYWKIKKMWENDDHKHYIHWWDRLGCWFHDLQGNEQTISANNRGGNWFFNASTVATIFLSFAMC